MRKVKENLLDKTIYILQIIAFTAMYSIVSEWLINYNPETLIENWGVGLIGVCIFCFFYIIDNLSLFLFRIDKINKFFVLFFLSWFLADLNDFITIILQLGGFI